MPAHLNMCNFVQAAVVSLARDPAIWDAFVKNEKVQELMRSRNMNVSQSGGTYCINLVTFTL